MICAMPIAILKERRDEVQCMYKTMRATGHPKHMPWARPSLST
jgi:hypothetical protein